jgi:hypothetical protein
MGRNRLRGLAGAFIMTCLWAWSNHPSWAQHPEPAGGETRSGTQRSVYRTLSEAVRSARPRLRLAAMETVGSTAPQEPFGPSQQLSDREQLAADSAAQALVEQLTRPGPRRSALLRTARTAARLIDAPNRALCRLTGADRARLDLGRKRVSFTWFVSID